MTSRTNIFRLTLRNSFSNSQAKTEQSPDKLLSAFRKLLKQFTLEKPQSLKVNTRPNNSKSKEKDQMKN